MSRTILIVSCLLWLIATVNARASSESFLPYYKSGTVEFVEDLTIGGDTDDDDYILFLPTDLAVGPAGNIYVLDYKMCWIKKFTPDGELLTTFSREGEGPGEIARANRMIVTPEGNVVVFDSGNHRFTVFNADGEYLDSRNFQGYVEELEPGPGGAIFALMWQATAEWNTKGTLYQVVRFSPDLQEQTVVDSAYVKNGIPLQVTDDSMTITSAPFVARLMCAASPGAGFYIGHGKEYAIKRFSPELDVANVIRRDVDRLKVTQADKDEYYSSYDDNENLQILVREKVPFPGRKPHFDGIFIDHEGYVLVETYEAAKLEDNAVYDVFAPDGEFVNRLEMLRLKPATVFRDGFMYTTKTGGEVFPAVIRYRPIPVPESANP